MTARAGRVLVAVLLSACAASCGPPKPILVDFSASPRNYRGRDYADVYQRWTRRQKVLRGVDHVIEVWATFKSWDFREAYLQHYFDVYSTPEGERGGLRQAQRESESAAFEFHVTAQSGRFEWNDFEKRTSAWRITLVDATGRELLPERIEALRLPDAYQEEFFPDRTPFSRSYLVRFARPSDFDVSASGGMTLRIASPLGRAELVWQNR